MKMRTLSIVVSLFLFAGDFSTQTLFGYLQQVAVERGDSPTAVCQAIEPDAKTTDDPGDEHSDAERIAELTEAIDSDKEQLAALTTELGNPESEYAIAEREFRSLNEQRDQLLEEFEEAKADSKTQSETLAKLTSDVDTQTTLWRLAKERFDLAIEDRKTLKEQLYTLTHKLQQDQEALQLLTDGPQPT